MVSPLAPLCWVCGLACHDRLTWCLTRHDGQGLDHSIVHNWHNNENPNLQGSKAVRIQGESPQSNVVRIQGAMSIQFPGNSVVRIQSPGSTVVKIQGESPGSNVVRIQSNWEQQRQKIPLLAQTRAVTFLVQQRGEIDHCCKYVCTPRMNFSLSPSRQ